ncbi:hypothetical protein [Intrasporangium sp. DVR]|uniref:hypothetical protein n=1 Tax=Intrasporangium sp. DVR TaxID=3127867 RepID=UPI00313A56C9
MSDRLLTLVAQGEEATRELPMSPIVYFLIAFGLFLVALGVTWSFRNTAHKVPLSTHVDQHGRIQIEGHPSHPHHVEGTQH